MYAWKDMGLDTPISRLQQQLLLKISYSCVPVCPCSPAYVRTRYVRLTQLHCNSGHLFTFIYLSIHLFSLADHVILSETINTFKSRLDKFWQHQDMIYDFQAELHGTGSRSLHSS